jgi:PAS domain S-box-containing protein
VSDAVISINNGGLVTYLNPSAERQYDRTAERALGRPLADLYTFRWINKEDEAAAAAALERRGFWHGENLHVRHDGRTLHVDSSVSVLHDASGAAVGLLAVIRDVTAARRAEEALRESNQRQRMALDAAALGTWRHRIEDGVVELDARARAHYGVDAPRVAIDEILTRIHPDDAGVLRQAIAASLDPARRAAVRAEYRVVKSDGTVCWLAISGQVQFDDSGGAPRPTIGVGTTRDITEQKHAEDSLREADRRKDEFLAILAHELRNPLAPIRTAVGILRTPSVPDPIAARSRDVIERQVAHMTRLIDDLLDVSRLSRGKMNLQRGPLLLDQVLDAAVETARPWIQERRHAFEQRRLAEAVCLEGDLARLSQVFANLLNNAAKFTPADGRIQLDVAEGTDRVEVRVTDSGQGIAPEHLDAIFDLFTQSTNAGAPAAGGLGIGLTLARRLVELHGGSLTAASDGPGRGATFTVTLPVSPSAHAGCAPGQPEPARARNLGRRVLVVDDNVDAAETSAALLAAAGCVVDVAFSGEQALASASRFQPEIVLLDLGMPGLSGIDRCARLRDTAAGGALYIAAVTGWGQDEDRRRTQAAGFDAHLVKPVPPDALLALIEQAPRPTP